MAPNPRPKPGAEGAPGGSLATMVLPELRALASQVGVKGTSGMRKGELIAAIREIRRADPRNGGRSGGSDQTALRATGAEPPDGAKQPHGQAER